jgi:hypothetical protein
MDSKSKIRKAALVGLVPLLLEVILIYAVDSQTESWILIQSGLAWFSFGFVIHLINKSKRIVLNSVLLTIILNLPWYVAESIAKNMPEHLIPLIVASIIMGTIIGFVSKSVERKISIA